jgi:hypothetical protein
MEMAKLMDIRRITAKAKVTKTMHASMILQAPVVV